MTPQTVSVAVLLSVVVLGVGLGFAARRRGAPNLEEWAVGGRGFGALLVWLLLAGELFTTYSLLGLSGWMYSRGGPTIYALAYLPLAQIAVYFVWPRIWELGRRHRMHTLADYFGFRYASRALTVLVALVALICLMVYVQIQLLGLATIVSFAGNGAITRGWAICGAAALVAAFVFTSGVRGIAWVSILKDVLLTVGALFLGIAVPWIHFGGLGPMFEAVEKARPMHLTMPGSTPNLGHTWFMTSILVSVLGAFCWPHTFSSLFTARNADVIRRNAVMMPLASLALLFVMFAGVAAILVVPGLKNGDLALLSVVKVTFPAWALGLLGGAGVLTAMVPASSLLLAASTLVAKNLWVPITGRTLDGRAVAVLARSVVIGITAGAAMLAFYNPASLASLLLMAYSGVAQFSCGVLLGVFWKRATALGVGLGLVAGVMTAGWLTAAGLDPFHGFNAGLVGAAVNFAVTAAVSVAVPVRVQRVEGAAA